MTSPTLESSTPLIDNDALLLISALLITTIVGGAFFLAVKSLEALKISVPQETIAAIGTQIISIMRTSMDAMKTRVEDSPNPIDNVIYAAAEIPLDTLIAEIQRRVSDSSGAISVEAGGAIETLKTHFAPSKFD